MLFHTFKCGSGCNCAHLSFVWGESIGEHRFGDVFTSYESLFHYKNEFLLVPISFTPKTILAQSSEGPKTRWGGRGGRPMKGLIEGITKGVREA
jgi:hypothetical protein